MPTELSSALSDLLAEGGSVTTQSVGSVTVQEQPLSQATCVNGQTDCNATPACLCPTTNPDCMRDGSNPLAPAGTCVVSHRVTAPAFGCPELGAVQSQGAKLTISHPRHPYTAFSRD